MAIINKFSSLTLAFPVNQIRFFRPFKVKLLLENVIIEPGFHFGPPRRNRGIGGRGLKKGRAEPAPAKIRAKWVWVGKWV